eukprot:TRINITY_DN30323_c0_g1_i2.p1 TRINITY_DN30323_c0_g1~~TRINITY_DN30323_c0_g1_i2.p1  ORF type:complete len:493 (-),score=76.93 TRINITY_DN30323_c0_g1_i2:452-1930(-)
MWADGDIYVGEWHEDQLHGLGAYYSADGTEYYGEFASGVRDGQGCIRHTDGSIYKGQLEGNEMSGHGTLSIQKGGKEWSERYMGQWKSGFRYGEGLYLKKTGLRYKGEFLYGDYHGSGNLIFPSGDSYEGEFRDGRLHGHGTYFWAETNETYQGEWVRGVMCGDGKLEYTSLTFPLLEKKEDEMQQRVNYEGQWFNNQPHGAGRLIGCLDYDGEFKDGKRHGTGKEFWDSGTTFEGQFEQEVRNGEATIRYNDNSVWRGRVVDDIRHGEAKMFITPDHPKGRRKSISRKKSISAKTVEHYERWHYGQLSQRDKNPVKATTGAHNSGHVVDDMAAREKVLRAAGKLPPPAKKLDDASAPPSPKTARPGSARKAARVKGQGGLSEDTSDTSPEQPLTRSKKRTQTLPEKMMRAAAAKADDEGGGPMKATRSLERRTIADTDLAAPEHLARAVTQPAHAPPRRTVGGASGSHSAKASAKNAQPGVHRNTSQQSAG